MSDPLTPGESPLVQRAADQIRLWLVQSGCYTGSRMRLNDALVREIRAALVSTPQPTCEKHNEPLQLYCVRCEEMSALKLASTPQEKYESLAVVHTRKQGAANGFWDGWHAALNRVKEGDRVHDLRELVPAAPRALTADGELLTDLFNIVLGDLEWVRAQGGRHSVCPLCHAVCERDGGPGHQEDCPRFEFARRFDAWRAASTPSPTTEPRLQELITKMRVVIEAVRAVGTAGHWDAPHWTLHVPAREANALFDLAYELDPELVGATSAPEEPR